MSDAWQEIPVDQGEVLDVASEEFRKHWQLARRLLDQVIDAFEENGGEPSGVTLLYLAYRYEWCLPDLWTTANYLGSRGPVQFDIEGPTKDDPCECLSCYARRSYISLSYDDEADIQLAKQQKWEAQRKRERQERRAQESAQRRNKGQLKTALVYLIEAGSRYKIGITTNLNKRLSQLSKQAPFPLHVVHTVTCNDAWKVEQHLHQQFDEYRRHGEWFEFDSDQIAAVIETMQDTARTNNAPATTEMVHAE